jgi:putative restriction endonuclease
MTSSELLRKVADIKVWRRHDERAPHKPLLLLYALSHISEEQTNAIPYAELDVKLAELLREFGPRRKSIRTQFPFLRLRNDGLWDVRWKGGESEPPAGNIDLSRGELLENNAVGRFPPEVYHLLVARPRLRGKLIGDILTRNFPESIHDDILEALGIQPAVEIVRRRVRDPKFRQRVLDVYDHRCAICGFDVKVSNAPVALEAAHIKWRQVNGPDTEVNGIAFCVMHHRLFDRGAFTIGTDLTFSVSNEVSGTSGVAEWLQQYHGQPIRKPSRVEYLPAEEFIGWHHTEVFRGSMP